MRERRGTKMQRRERERERERSVISQNWVLSSVLYTRTRAVCVRVHQQQRFLRQNRLSQLCVSGLDAINFVITCLSLSVRVCVCMVRAIMASRHTATGCLPLPSPPKTTDLITDSLCKILPLFLSPFAICSCSAFLKTESRKRRERDARIFGKLTPPRTSLPIALNVC